MDNEKQKPRKKKKSSIPIYAVGLVWISYAIEGKLTSFGGVIGCAALSLAAYFVLKLIFPDRMEEAEKQPEQKPAETQPAQKPQPEPQKPEPTTIKLLEQYVVLQNQGMRVGNIDEGMTKIENMLEKVIAAFQQQLDSLFENDVVDITAEIRVMEKMMASEGLAGTNDFK